MIGQTISHYKILEKLGEGGMGVVYKAYDTSLKRDVALKFLPADLTRDSDARKRFIHEAQAAAALDHPNICAVHEIGQSEGQSFIVMPLVEGESLRDRLQEGALGVDEALDVALQVGRGLAKAHGSGIVHRDVKPGNVLLATDGHAKVVDFGLAKLATQTRLTKTGMTVGTVGYMSPEQAKGEGVDHRTDVWSLGVMLYEMLTGRAPFRGDADPAVVYSILNEDPEPVTAIRREVPVALEDVVERALAKAPGKRFETMDEMLAALETVEAESQLGIKRRHYAAIKRLKRRKRLLAVSATVLVIAIAAVLITTFYKSGQAIDSLLVLPLETLSGNEDQDILAKAFTIELISNFSRLSALKVKPRSTSMRYVDTDKSPREIAEELDVKGLVGGMIQIDGDDVRITADLIDGSTEELLWSDTFESPMRDILALVGEIAQTVADEIHVSISPEEREFLAADRPVNPVAYRLYRRGLYQYEKWTKEGFEKAIDDFQKAIEADPNYAKAYDGLADCYLWLWWSGELTPNEALSKAYPPLRKALEIDDLLPEAHETLAGIKHYLQWDWLGGEAGYRRVIELDPSFIEARCELAICLSAMGRSEEAISEAKRAQQLDPVSLPANRCLGYVLSNAREYEQAIAHYGQMAELWPDQATVFRGLTRTYLRMGRHEDAVRVYKKAVTLKGGPPEKVAAAIAALDSAYGASGPKGYWMWMLERYEGKYDRYPYVVARCYAQLGDKNQAIHWLEKAYTKHDGPMQELKVDPLWDPLRSDLRYQDLVRRMNFPEDESY